VSGQNAPSTKRPAPALLRISQWRQRVNDIEERTFPLSSPDCLGSLAVFEAILSLKSSFMCVLTIYRINGKLKYWGFPVGKPRVIYWGTRPFISIVCKPHSQLGPYVARCKGLLLFGHYASSCIGLQTSKGRDTVVYDCESKTQTTEKGILYTQRRGRSQNCEARDGARAGEPRAPPVWSADYLPGRQRRQQTRLIVYRLCVYTSLRTPNGVTDTSSTRPG